MGSKISFSLRLLYFGFLFRVNVESSAKVAKCCVSGQNEDGGNDRKFNITTALQS